MRCKYTPGTILVAGAALGLLTGCPEKNDSTEETPTEEETPTPEEETPTAELETSFQSITTLAFAGDGTLLIGDSGTGKVHAITPPSATNPQAQAAYNLRDIDGKIAELLGTTTPNVRVRDLAIHPTTKEAYLAVGRVTGDTFASAVVVINQGGDARLLDPTDTGTELRIPATPAEDFDFYDTFEGRNLTFTDLEVHEGKLYIAGLSNADFASSLWTAPLPLTDEVQTTTVEIYHAVHDQQETRAPIRT
ncbi:MAG: hypothetical protein AAGF12_37340, partial [Myxococcota bacterium]